MLRAVIGVLTLLSPWTNSGGHHRHNLSENEDPSRSVGKHPQHPHFHVSPQRHGRYFATTTNRNNPITPPQCRSTLALHSAKHEDSVSQNYGRLLAATLYRKGRT